MRSPCGRRVAPARPGLTRLLKDPHPLRGYPVLGSFSSLLRDGYCLQHAQSAAPQGPGEAGAPPRITANADSIFSTCGLPHFGQHGGASSRRESNASKRCAQAQQRYSKIGMLPSSVGRA